MNIRLIVIILLMTMSLTDLVLTYHYVSSYKKWQPEKPYAMIENNPLLVFLWNSMGLKIGMFVGSVIILSLIYIVGKTAHPVVVGLLFLLLTYALHNHYININLIGSLIEKYPLGHLPEKVFGTVIGNNPK